MHRARCWLRFQASVGVSEHVPHGQGGCCVLSHMPPQEGGKPTGGHGTPSLRAAEDLPLEACQPEPPCVQERVCD